MTDNGIIRPFLAIATDANRFRTIADVKKAILTVDTIVYTIGKEQVTDGNSRTYIIKESNVAFFGENFQLDNGLWACEVPSQTSQFLGILDTKEKGDKVLQNGLRTGYYAVVNFNTVFPNNNISPQVYQYGILEVIATPFTTAWVILKYTPHTTIVDPNNMTYKLVGAWDNDTQTVKMRGNWTQDNKSVFGNATGAGTFVRLSDGTMMLTVLNLNIQNYVNGTPYQWGIYFYDIPVCSIATTSNGQLTPIQISASKGDFRLYNVEQRQEQTVSIIAIGRWKA